MTLAVLKASPFGVGDQLTSVEMNILNDEIVRAVDGINGGTYVLTAQLNFTSASFGLSLTKLDFANSAAIGFGTSVTIAGSPTWTGSPVFSGLVSVGAVTIASTGGPGGAGVLTIGATATLSVIAGATTTFANNPVFSAGHTVDFNGTVHINATGEVVSGALLSIDAGATLSVVGTATVTGTLGVAGTLLIGSGGVQTVQSGGGLVVASGGTLNVNSGATATFASAVSFTGPSISIANGLGVTLAGIIQPSGAGHVRKRVVTAGLDTTVTFGINDGDVFHGVITANQNWTVSTVGASRGDILMLSISGSGAHTASVVSSTTVSLGTITDTVTNANGMLLYFNGSDWVSFWRIIF
jgi:hypothetical protein